MKASLILDLPQAYADLLHAADRRRGSAPVRAVVGFAIAFALEHQIGWTWTYLWACAYAAAQILEMAVLRPSARPRWAAPSMPRAGAILGLFLLPALLYAPLAIPIWREARYGPLMAVLLLAGGGLNLLVMAGVSAAAFLAPFAIYIVVWVVMIATDQRLEPAYQVLAMLLAVVVIANCLLAWHIQAKALRAARRAMQEAERGRAAAQAASDAKSAFVALLSHDLRGPVGDILSAADRLDRGQDAASITAQIRGAGTSIRDLLDDLLDMERMDAGAMPVDPIVFDLRCTLAGTLRLWRPDAARIGVRLRLEGGRCLPRLVSGDPARLRQVLNNLLSNALKHTPRGAIVVQAVRSVDGVRLIVEDAGPGLGSDPDRVFEPFDLGRVAGGLSGLGLGLSLSRKLARLMGGDLTAANRAGGGAAFTLDLPLIAATARPEPQRDGPVRVLIVDDHALNRETLRILLEPLDVETVLADSGEAALAALAQARFDVVLMDVHMPGMDGRETTRRLRIEGGVNHAVPVIAVSAADTPRDWRSCVEAGMASHVAKPIRPHRLYEAINAALPLRLAA